MEEKTFAEKDIDEKRLEFISEKNAIIEEMQGAIYTCAQDILSNCPYSWRIAYRE